MRRVRATAVMGRRDEFRADGLRLPPTLEGTEDARCGGDLDDFARDEGSDGERPCRRDAMVSVAGEPAGAEEEDGKGGSRSCDQSASEARGHWLHGANYPTGYCCSQGV